MDTLNFDAFSSSQIQSKQWLAETLEFVVDEHMPTEREGYRIWILAGWYAVTNFILQTRKKIKILEVRSFDIDPSCEEIADKINNLWVWQAWKFKAHTADINELEYKPKPQIVINSSLEHMLDNKWFDNIPKGTLVCLQASDMHHDDHHVNIRDIRDLMVKYPLDEICYDGVKRFQYDDFAFNRYMIIGFK